MEPRLDNETLLDNCSPKAPKVSVFPPSASPLFCRGAFGDSGGGRGTAEKSRMLGREIGDDRTSDTTRKIFFLLP